MLNVETLRDAMEEIHNYREKEQTYNFYYDETNNYRGVKLTETGFNDNKVLKNNFTLSGICINKETVVQLNDVMKRLKLQPNQELKSKKFFKKRNEFKECISHPKLHIILEWILSNAYIHYTDVDALYYTVIDIVDSFFDTKSSMMIYSIFDKFLKSELYVIIRENIGAFLCLCAETSYPNVEGANIENFCNKLIMLIENYEKYSSNPVYTMEIFKSFIKEKLKSTGKLIFLQNNKEKTIMDESYASRQQRCIMFKDSYHVFDNEFIDEEKMKKIVMQLNEEENLKNFEFCDSKSRAELQISDIVAYLIAKYLTFITFTSAEDVKSTIENLDDYGLKNLQCFMEILKKSENENKFFIEGIIPLVVLQQRMQMNEYIINLIKSNRE